jgi:hypothetical protein
MSPDAQRLLEEARNLPPDDFNWLLENLFAQSNDEAFAALEKEYGAPEPGYDVWFRAGVEEALADDGAADVPHEEAMKQFHEAIQKARKATIPS